MKDYKAGIYLRLSKEDSEVNNSIDFQREITTKYAKEHNYTIVKEYVDNGYSGILSSRPELNKMIMDIVRNNINMVIVKDTSRLTRDKNLTSYYTDILFPDNDIRFISVTEYIDKNAPGGKEHIGYIIDRTGFMEFKKWALEGVTLSEKALMKNNVYWSGIHYTNGF